MTVLPDKILAAMPESERKRLGKAGVTSDQAQAAFEARNERELQRQINNWLLLQQNEGRLYFNWNRSDKRTTCRIGWADYTILLPHGRLLLMEAKFGDGKLSPEQMKLQSMCLLLGHAYVVVTTLQAAITTIKTMTNQTP